MHYRLINHDQYERLSRAVVEQGTIIVPVATRKRATVIRQKYYAWRHQLINDPEMHPLMDQFMKITVTISTLPDGTAEMKFFVFSGDPEIDAALEPRQ